MRSEPSLPDSTGRAARLVRVLCVGLALGLSIGASRAADLSDDGTRSLRADADQLLNTVRLRIASCGAVRQLVASAATASDSIVPERRPQLERNPMLEAAAARHASAMARTRLFDHVGADGSTVRERVNETGYQWKVIGENLAAGHDRLEDAVRDWLDSEAHCTALLDPRYTQYGIARMVSNSPNDAYGVYWALVLGRPR